MCNCGIELAWLDWGGIRQWLFDWQGLITGFMALGAAFVALQPVKKQLALMRAQNNVMVRETIGHMITQLDQHRDQVHQIIQKGMRQIYADLNHFEVYGPSGMMHQWALERRSDLSPAEDELRALFVTSHDVDAIESQKDTLLLAVRKLDQSLWDIWEPEDATFRPEEYNWTDEQRTAAYDRAVEAENSLSEKTRAISFAVRDLKEAYANQRAVLVRQLRVIDDGLLNGVALQGT